MKTLFFFLTLLCFEASFSQNIKGIVTYYQSNGKPASGIEIYAFGCTKTFSQENGIFILQCPKKSIGQSVRLFVGPTNSEGKQIEIVNDAQLKYLTVPVNSDSSTIDIIVCYPGEKERTALKYYNLMEYELLDKLSNDVNKITKSLDNINLETEERKEFVEKLNRIKSERDLAQLQVKKLADYIATINIPKANILIKNAIKAIETGKGTEKALAILNVDELKKEEIYSKFRYFENLSKILEGYHLRIKLLLPKFNYKEVISSYIEIIRIIENNEFKGNGLANLYTSLAYIYFLDGQYDNSVAAQEKGMSLWLNEETYSSPIEAGVLKNMGIFNEALGNNKKALEFLLRAEGIIEKSPDTTKINALGFTYSKIGNTYLKLNNYKKGMEYLQKGVHLLETSNIPFDRTRILGIVYDNLAKGFKALSDYKNSLDNQLKSIKLLESVHIIANPELATVYNNTANLFIELGRYEEAESYAKKALDIRVSTLSSKHPQVIQSYLTQANILFQSEKYNESMLKAQKVIALLDSSSNNHSVNLITARQIYGYSLIKLKRLDEGLRVVIKSIDLRKKYSPEARLLLLIDYTNLSSAYFESGDLEKAKYFINVALKLNLEEFSQEQSNLGLIYWTLVQIHKKEDLTKAYYYHEKCDLIFKNIYSPSHPFNEKIDNLLIELEVLKGSNFYMSGKYLDALKQFSFVVSKKKSFKIVSYDKEFSVYQLIGSCFYQIENYESAIEAYKNALEVDPKYKSEDYYNDLGLSYFKIKSYAKAKFAFDKYQKIFPNNWRPYRNLALFNAEMNNEGLVISNLKKAIDLGFNNKKWLKNNKSFDNLKKNSTYKNLLKEMD